MLAPLAFYNTLQGFFAKLAAEFSVN